MKPMIGLTGGIGSGKSEVARMFAILGAAVYAADEASKMLLDHNSRLKDKLITSFGNELYHNSKLDRKTFAQLIFSNKESLILANSIIHPFVFEDFENWILTRQECSYVIMEAAILFESKANERLDKTIAVYSPSDLRISRVMKRDNCSREVVLQRMQHQMPEEQKVKMADFILYNDDEHMLIPQVLELDKLIKSCTL